VEAFRRLPLSPEPFSATSSAAPIVDTVPRTTQSPARLGTCTIHTLQHQPHAGSAGTAATHIR
jgi:hypothetical protein